jgi:hypothetical protein
LTVNLNQLKLYTNRIASVLDEVKSVPKEQPSQEKKKDISKSQEAAATNQAAAACSTTLNYADNNRKIVSSSHVGLERINKINK